MTRPATLASVFEGLIGSLENLGGTRPAAPAAREVRDSRPIVPIESLAPDEPSPRGRGETPADDRTGWDLAASFSRYEALVVQSGAPAAPQPVAAPVAAETVVAIESLLYGGRSALLRADTVRREIRRVLTAQEPVTTVLPLVDELLDLVELAIAD